MVYDFHTHTFLSDGELTPIELARRAHGNGYAALAITDHRGMGGLQELLQALREDCRVAQSYWGFPVFPGVELTHLPSGAIAEGVRAARDAGAVVVIVHGETPVEPVDPGTNLAAVNCPEVDILAHPGFITLEEAYLAAQNGVFLELSARRGHSLANGHVAATAKRAQASLLVDSDAHSPEDLLTPSMALAVARGAGLDEDTIKQVTQANARTLVERLLQRWS